MCADDFLVTLMRAEGTIILMTLSDGDFVDGDDDKSFVASSRGPFEEALHGHSCLYGGMELGKRSIAIRGSLVRFSQPLLHTMDLSMI